jgi:YHS domain-containing protein
MKKIIVAVFATVFAFNTGNAQAALRTKQFNAEKGLAIQGYDPVAYFTQNKAVKGSKQFVVLAEGVTYYLSSAVNKELFLKDYKKYEPQYGGWCAYAMGATNEKVEIDPETFKIVNGKLFLFYHSWINNTLTKWNKDEANLKSRADANWTKIFN